ncbi:anthrone oxygenase family protein [Sphaerisporangium perillae]|uniref:anthrone oxygenase family protein n=1 Tax=Sphaerisporangium perillae TaxID=2935860 RepID=UPI00200E4431|nr:anthrone oxygenase family protein [Sphaerisporangium perillae]
MELLRKVVLVAATMSTGLIAGLFYAYACSVMPGLNKATDRTLVDTMQRINVAILNGWFALCFAGALVMTALTAILHLHQEGRALLPWLVAAVVLYAATLVITFAVNIPLNNALDAAGKPGDIADLAAVREAFEARWVRWNLARTLTSVAAFGSLVWAVIVS